MNAAYPELERRFAHIQALDQILEMLNWDRETHMPPGGAAARGEQLAALERAIHERLTDPALADLLAAAEDCPPPDPWQGANLRLMRRRWRHATALAADLVEASSRAVSAAIAAWSQARPAGDFAQFLPALREVVHLERQKAAAKAEAFATEPYDALLIAFEDAIPGQRIDALFARLAAVLPPLRDQAMARQRRRPAPRLPPGPFPSARQRVLGQRLMALAGFDGQRGRLDVSAHPFTCGAPGDVRITTRFDEDDFTGSVMAVMHETGHALYEQGLPQAWRTQPVGQAANMTIHESQSLLLEMQACRSKAFLAFAAPLMRQQLGGRGSGWSGANLYRLATRVAPGCIRVDADEIHYPLHIVLRTRLERALIAGTMEAAEIPAAWNEAMAELVGTVPPDHGQGCLQDIHWAAGLFGYFPSYTLGALAAAQLYRAACRQEAAIEAGLARGDFAPLLAWLRHNVHGHGASLDTQELIRRATGAPLSTDAFEAHLEERYLA